MSAVNKTFVSSLLMLIGVNLLIKPIYVLVIEARVQERVGAENFGIYFALLNLSFILNILPDLGITNWNNRHIAQRGTVLQSELKSLIRLRFALSAVYIATCVAVAYLINYESTSILILLVLAFNQVLSTGVLFFRSYLSGMHQFAADRIISVSDRIILIILLGSALLLTDASKPFPIEYLLYGQTIAYGLTLLFAFYIVRKQSTDNHSEVSIDSSSILQSSLPFAALILISMISNRVDAVMLERMTNSYYAGIYAMTFRLSDMLTMIAYLFAAILLPLFARMFSKQENPIELFGVAFRLLLTGCIWVVAVCILAPDWILNLVYDSNIENASEVLPWTMAAGALFSLQYTTGTLLTASGKMQQLIIISALALVCNVALNSFLIPMEMAVGAAQAACLTQALVFISQSIIAHLKYRIWTKSIIAHSLLFIAVISGCILFVFKTDWNPSISVLALSLIIVATAFILKMIPIRYLLITVSQSGGETSNQ